MINKINKRTLLSLYARWLYYTRALRTNKKIIVIESDDWGSIRTSNRQAYDILLQDDYDMYKSPYSLDALESNEDLTQLYSVLNSVIDSQGNPACFTANMIMANPDFEAIEKNNFSRYIYETVDKTLCKYEGRDKVRGLWKHGMETKIFRPQLHGREHVRYWDWMNALRENDDEVKKTFKLGMCGVPRSVSKDGKSYFKPAYIDQKILTKENVDLNQLISEGVELFKSEFGFYSKTTIAPNVAWNNNTESIWNNCKIEFIQGGFLQEIHTHKKVNFKAHFSGQKNKHNQTYLVRNCNFEPCKSNKEDYWQKTFKQVQRAFAVNTPAIISSHRINYIGSIKRKNRDWGLKQLNSLLNALTSKYPDIEFLSSAELGEYIKRKQTNFNL